MSSNSHFISLVVPPEQIVTPAWWLVFRGSHLLVRLDEHQAYLPQSPAIEPLVGRPLRQIYLGTLDGVHCFAAEVSREREAPAGWSFEGLRRLLALLPEPLFWLAGRAVQIVDWDRNHVFCGRCGRPTQLVTFERAKRCPDCDLVSYPAIAPAIIVSVERGDKLLLARSHRHPAGRFSVLAGFVEPGETLEETVAREVKEEVGLDVTAICYFGSQPWPFPNSLMVAFTCQYAGGEIILKDDEMAEAGWYLVDNLPRIPPPPTISRRLIDWFISRQSSAVQARSW
jgi:NAD+ diphosphatase